MSWKICKIGDFLKRSKIPIDINDDVEYKRVTIKIKHNGVSLRDNEIGRRIGTKKQFILKAGQFIVSKIDARYGAFGIAPEDVNGAIITGNFWLNFFSWTLLLITKPYPNQTFMKEIQLKRFPRNRFNSTTPPTLRWLWLTKPLERHTIYRQIKYAIC